MDGIRFPDIYLLRMFVVIMNDLRGIRPILGFGLVLAGDDRQECFLECLHSEENMQIFFFFPEDFEQYVNLNCYILYIFCQRVSLLSVPKVLVLSDQ